MQRTTEAGSGAAKCKGNIVIGLDLGDRWSRYCVLDEAGAVLEEGRVRSSSAELAAKFGYQAR